MIQSIHFTNPEHDLIQLIRSGEPSLLGIKYPIEDEFLRSQVDEWEAEGNQISSFWTLEKVQREKITQIKQDAEKRINIFDLGEDPDITTTFNRDDLIWNQRKKIIQRDLRANKEHGQAPGGLTPTERAAALEEVDKQEWKLSTLEYADTQINAIKLALSIKDVNDIVAAIIWPGVPA